MTILSVMLRIIFTLCGSLVLIACGGDIKTIAAPASHAIDL